MKLVQRTSSILITVILLAATLAYLVAGYFPQRMEIAGLRRDINLAATALAEVSHYTARVQPLREQLQETRQFSSTWQQRTRPSDQVGVVFGRISRLAQEAGVTVSQFTPQLSTPYSRLQRVPLEMICTGSFTQCSSFLCALEALDELIWVDQLSFEKAGQDGEALKLGISLSIFTDQAEISG